MIYHCVAVATATTTAPTERSTDENTATNTTTIPTTAANDVRPDTTHIENGDITIGTRGGGTITIPVTANVGIALRLVVAHLG